MVTYLLEKDFRQLILTSTIKLAKFKNHNNIKFNFVSNTLQNRNLLTQKLHFREIFKIFLNYYKN